MTAIFKDIVFKYILITDSKWNIAQSALRYHPEDLAKVNIGSGNGLVPSGNKPLPEPMLTQISVDIWRH